MAQVSHLLDELAALRGALSGRHGRAAHPAEDGVDPAPDTAAPPEPDLAAALEGLKAELSDLTDAAEEIVAEHPAAAVASAFLLGILVGRLSKGGAPS